MGISVVNLAIGLLILFPQTFFLAYSINAVMILLIMAFALTSGNIKTALIENTISIDATSTDLFRASVRKIKYPSKNSVILKFFL